ncbi:MAG: DNA polymerase III subunit gamma/tau [Tenericutes bacterium]|nr:MAG: DNA polymerase III subunit gamma/tau [Mycoplasmatota bacterium]
MEALYSKYRPTNFEEVAGQVVPKQILLNSIRKNKINHAYLFYGIRGTGKTTLARIFAKTINCAADTAPCNMCDSCKSINQSTSLNVIEMDAASNSGVEDVRSLIANSSLISPDGKKKIYIIDEVHMLSKSAFNALLKTLEEPPRDTMFLFATTEINRIPDTILSRTLVINLQTLSDEDISSTLENIVIKEGSDFEKGSIEYIVSLSGGSMRDAITLLELCLLYSNSLKIGDVIKVLGIIKKEEIEDMLLRNPMLIKEVFERPEIDPKRLLLLVIETLNSFFINGSMTKNLSILSADLLQVFMTIKDPNLLRSAIPSIILRNINVPRETSSKIIEVKQQESTINTPIIEKVIEPPAVDANTKEIPQSEDHQSDEPPVIDTDTKEMPQSQDQQATEPSKNTLLDHVETQVIPNDVEITYESEKKQQTPSNVPRETSSITDSLTIMHYETVLFEQNELKRERLIEMWELMISGNNKYTNILMTGKILASSESAIILGFSNEMELNAFKSLSLDHDMYDEVERILGFRHMILPILPAN